MSGPVCVAKCETFFIQLCCRDAVALCSSLSSTLSSNYAAFADEHSGWATELFKVKMGREQLKRQHVQLNKMSQAQISDSSKLRKTKLYLLAEGNGSSVHALCARTHVLQLAAVMGRMRTKVKVIILCWRRKWWELTNKKCWKSSGCNEF